MKNFSGPPTSHITAANTTYVDGRILTPPPLRL